MALNTNHFISFISAETTRDIQTTTLMTSLAATPSTTTTTTATTTTTTKMETTTIPTTTTTTTAAETTEAFDPVLGMCKKRMCEDSLDFSRYFILCFDRSSLL